MTRDSVSRKMTSPALMSLAATTHLPTSSVHCTLKGKQAPVSVSRCRSLWLGQHHLTSHLGHCSSSHEARPQIKQASLNSEVNTKGTMISTKMTLIQYKT